MDVVIHLKSHSDICEYQCFFCNYQGKYLFSLKRHLKRHKQEKSLNNGSDKDFLQQMCKKNNPAPRTTQVKSFAEKETGSLSTSSSQCCEAGHNCEQVGQTFNFCEDMPVIAFDEKPVSVKID